MTAHIPPSQPNFDRVARLYRWAEYLTLGPLLQQTRTALLDRLSGCRQALLLGDGDGRFCEQLMLRCPAMRATAVDTSAAMLHLLQTRCGRIPSTGPARLTTWQSSALEMPIPAATDLIVTHFFLDCLSQADVDRLAERIAATVQPGALWLVSDFAIPDKPLLGFAARLYIRALYLAFRVLTGLAVQHLPSPQAAFTANGFRRLATHRKLSGLLYSELWVLEATASLARHNPAVSGFIHTPMDPAPTPDSRPATNPGTTTDVQPDPEPAVPSLPEPDPGVFRHPHRPASDATTTA